MKREDIGFILLLTGAAISFFAFSADILGITGDPAAIGWKQFVGAGFGLVVIIIGVWLIRSAKKEE